MKCTYRIKVEKIYKKETQTSHYCEAKEENYMQCYKEDCMAYDSENKKCRRLERDLKL